MTRNYVTFGFAVVCLGALMGLTPAHAATLHVGAASTSIPPDKPVAVSGQMSTRIAREVQTEVQANALAMESREGNETHDQAIFVACGVVYIPEEVSKKARELLASRVPDFDIKKLIMSATHTHTGPVMREGKYKILDEDVMRPADYAEFLAGRIADVAETAWKARKPAKVGWGMGDAVIGYNRRSFFADGHGQMYGDISIDDFRGIEGPEDHAVEVLFFWDENDALMATAINVVCPAQEVESLSVVNADYWHPVREALRQQYGDNLVVLGWCGAAGDQNPYPHILYRKSAEERMRRLRGDGNETARRIVRAVNEAYEVVKNDRHADVPLVHSVQTIHLPMRLVTEAEYAEAKAGFQQAADQIAKDPKSKDRMHGRMIFHKRTIERFEAQAKEPEPTYEMELHVLRLGDVVVCTNPFELFTEYGIRIKGRSKAIQTFLVQLAGHGWYLPTEQAVRGGSYSAVVASCRVGPEGGQMLVDRTVEAINKLFAPSE